MTHDEPIVVVVVTRKQLDCLFQELSKLQLYYNI